MQAAHEEVSAHRSGEEIAFLSLLSGSFSLPGTNNVNKDAEGVGRSI